jgi:hypothetical protein
MKPDDPFIARINKERQSLQKQLADLDTAERIYLGMSTKSSPEADSGFTVTPLDGGPKPTIQSMILWVLAEGPPDGVEAKEIVRILKDRWAMDIKKQNLFPKLSFFKDKGWASNKDGVWKITDEGQMKLIT